MPTCHNGLFYTDEGLCPKRLYIFLLFNDTLKSFPLPFSCFYNVTHCFPIFRFYPILPTLRKKKDNQSLLVLLDDSKDSINKRFGLDLQLTSGRSQKPIHLTEMQMIINIQIFTCVRLLRKAKFLLATQGIIIIIITFISIARIQLYSFQMRFTMLK